MVSDIRSSNSSKVQATCDMAASVTTCSRVVVWLGGGGEEKVVGSVQGEGFGSRGLRAQTLTGIPYVGPKAV